jgi:hypothetical protein
MSRIATVKETGLELSQEEWTRFEEAVAPSLSDKPHAWPFGRRFKTQETEQLPPLSDQKTFDLKTRKG